jgi:hypothetical protein
VLQSFLARSSTTCREFHSENWALLQILGENFSLSGCSQNSLVFIFATSANWKLPSPRIALGAKLSSTCIYLISPLGSYISREINFPVNYPCASITPRRRMSRPTNRPTSLIVNYRVQNSSLACTNWEKTCALTHNNTGKNQHHLPAHQVQKRQLFDKYLQLAVRA